MHVSWVWHRSVGSHRADHLPIRHIREGLEVEGLGWIHLFTEAEQMECCVRANLIFDTFFKWTPLIIVVEGNIEANMQMTLLNYRVKR